MKQSPEYLQKRFETCRRLFFQYEGREHARIEREMRASGFPDFNRRCLYARGVNSGWIEKYRWDRDIQRRAAEPQSQNRLRERAASSLGGLATDNTDKHRSADATFASAKSPRLTTRHSSPATENINDFHAWLKKVSPPSFDWDAKHLKYIIEKLQLFTEGKIKRLMIFMPPRHGKSELVTTRYTAWRLMKDPKLKVILASYNQHLANRFSRNIRNTLAEHLALEQVERVERVERVKSQRNSKDSQDSQDSLDSPDYLSNPFRSQTVNSSAEWETGKGGGVKAVGVGGGITCYGAGLMMIDDPIKSREQAESQSYRDKVWHWFNDDMMTRLEPDAGVILIQTRWHEDDLAGRLLKQQQEEGTEEWHVINLPAIAEHPTSSPPYDGGVDAASADGAVLSDPPRMMPARHLAYTTMPPYPAGKNYGDILRERESQNRLRERAASSVRAETAKQHGSTRNIHRRDAEPQSLYCRSLQRTVADEQNDLGLQPNSDMGLKPDDLIETLDPLPKGNGNKGIGDTGTVETDPSLLTVPYPLLTGPDPLNRAPGEALWPERFPVETLERIRRGMGSYSFESLYQQKPVPTEGGLFKRSWFTNNIVQTPPPNLNWKRGYDLSFTANPDSDPTATLKVAYDKDGTVYIDGCFRGKLTYPLQRKMLLHYIRSETRTEHGIELSANGHALLQDLRRMPELRGKKFRGVKVDSNKLTRALPWMALAEEGRVRLVAGRWNEDFIQEACSFPHARHDDQIDAVSVAIKMHGSKPGSGFWRF